MAKKKKQKQKKAGLLKRQKNRQEKKISRKKRLIAAQPVQKKMSQSKLKQSLKNLPSLIFEPELEEIAFSSEEVENAKNQYEKTPDQIEAIATPEFSEKMVAKLGLMKTRYEAENNQSKLMMVTAMLYFIEQENAPPFLNQLIVAMFCSTESKIETGQSLTDLKQLNKMLNEYDTTWRSYLEEKMAAIESGPRIQIPGESVDETEAEEVTVSLDSPFESVLNDFGAYLSTDLGYNEEDQERVLEDTEVLLNDYFEDKDITQLEDIRPRRIRTFLESWFIRTMHPTKEDLESMFVSLELFFKFSESKELLNTETCQEVLTILKNKETYLANLEV